MVSGTPETSFGPAVLPGKLASQATQPGKLAGPIVYLGSLAEPAVRLEKLASPVILPRKLAGPIVQPSVLAAAALICFVCTYEVSNCYSILIQSVCADFDLNIVL